MEEEQAPSSQDRKKRNNTIYEALPPLDSPEYFEKLQMATALELPAPVLARAFHQLCSAGHFEAMKATLKRLLTTDDKYGYLSTVRYLARKHVAPNQYMQDEEDLFQLAIIKIATVLPTKRGELAEIAWGRFCNNCFIDAWREEYRRHGERLEHGRVEPSLNTKSGEAVHPAENMDANDAPPWHVGLKKSELPAILNTKITLFAGDRVMPCAGTGLP